MWESSPTMPLACGFSWGSTISPPFYSVAAPYSPQSPSSALKTSILRGRQYLFTHSRRLSAEALPCYDWGQDGYVLHRNLCAETYRFPATNKTPPHHMLTSPTSATYCTLFFFWVHLQEGLGCDDQRRLTQTRYLRTMFWCTRSPIPGRPRSAAAITRTSSSFSDSTKVWQIKPLIWPLRKGGVKLENPEKTRRPAASSGTIITWRKSGSDAAGDLK
ncbi:hypothetical protein PR048_019505 [Dryococelus australis]|uniref:Uncharacterized protein n=1 Tax=Dryococelus australis TaxID=614101 RepID=A0ABQ9H3Q9_9NEOP|nr:hypothetical protein PR048_019505 [Dryococelus australis]